VELEVEGAAHRVTRIAKRPLARAVVIARHAHAALRDSGIVDDAARRGGVDALALTLDEPRRHAAQEGLWATRAQRTTRTGAHRRALPRRARAGRLG
jgi:hypothetical protein